MKLKDFTGNIHCRYRIVSVGKKEESLILVESKELPPPPKNAPVEVRRDPFYLVFHGSLSEEMESNLLEMKAPDGKNFVLSLNNEGPIKGAPEKGHQYFAGFS